MQTADGYGLGYRPGPVDISHTAGALPAALGRESVTYAATYDLRTMGKLTPVKNQNPYNTCWAHATYGSMESCLLPGETRDFSENNLVNLHGFDLDFNDGGNAAFLHGLFDDDGMAPSWKATIRIPIRAAARPISRGKSMCKTS